MSQGFQVAAVRWLAVILLLLCCDCEWLEPQGSARRNAALKDGSPGRQCSLTEVCVDSLSSDGDAWRDTIDGGFTCTTNYDVDPVHSCALYGGDIDAYGLTGNAACCLCGGGDCITAPEARPLIRESLMQMYAAMGGISWTFNTDWGSSVAYCKWYGVQ